LLLDASGNPSEKDGSRIFLSSLNKLRAFPQSVGLETHIIYFFSRFVNLFGGFSHTLLL